ncbi:hypothetical protein [Vibrio sp. McD22-P3]|uniref:hypothetical protein n=1 Tax=Vibrio sp. McD22-P3 TaxID=2724880 RepID=UPI001F24B7B0|nr:hypothetical protein [Vibrio sp. McD22-P3]MCF4176890.1 hypothetical protein [Vibrio sp. McD22-P3]
MNKKYFNLSIIQKEGRNIIILDECEIYSMEATESDEIHKVFDAIIPIWQGSCHC